MNIKRYKNNINVSKVNKVKYKMENNNRHGGVDMNTNTLQRHCTPSESLKNALEEMKLMRAGKIEKQSFWDMMKELDEDDE